MSRNPSLQPWSRSLSARAGCFALGSLLLVACDSEAEPQKPFIPYVPPAQGATGDAGSGEDSGTAPPLQWPPAPPLDAGDGDGLDADLPGHEDLEDGSVEAPEEPDADVPEPPPPNYGLPPFIADGAPLTAPDKKWTFIDFPDSFCRDGSTSGIGVSLNASSKNVMIYLEGGGACFDGITCLANPGNAGIMKGEKTSGLFNRTHADNPVKDWNYIYVPYCTGDVHMGTNDKGSVPGVFGTQKFVGYRNLEAFLRRVVPTFPDVEKVLLTGISAGGFGAAGNAVLVQRAFAGVAVNLIDDSGPPLSSKAMPACLQTKWRDTWGLRESILKDCGADCPNKEDFVFDYGIKLARTFTDRPSGLIEAESDSIIRGFFGAGVRDCQGTAIIDSVPEADFKAGLVEFREATKAYPSFGTWYPTGTTHTWLSGDTLYDAKIGDKRLIDWVADIAEGRGTSHVGLP